MRCMISVDEWGYAGKASKAVMKTRLATTDAAERKRNCDMADAMETSETLPGERNCAAGDASDNSDDLPTTQQTRCRVVDRHSAPVVGTEIAEAHSQRWNPNGAFKIAEARWDATNAPAAE